MQIVESLLKTDEGAEIRRKCGRISIRTVVAVATVEAATADSNGRNIQTSHETCAQRASTVLERSISGRTVERARRVLARLGVSTTTDEGRYLTKTERLAEQIRTGKKWTPWRKAAARALTISKNMAGVAAKIKCAGLPRSGLRNTLNSLERYLPKRALAHATAGSKKKQLKKNSKPTRRRRKQEPGEHPRR